MKSTVKQKKGIKETKEKYKDDETSFGKAAKIGNEVLNVGHEVLRGTFKIMKFIIENR
jgi:hypothetical protein